MNEVFGNYRLLEKIGSGGLGEVFRAQDSAGADFALKRLAQQHRADEDYAALFMREIDVARQLAGSRLLSALDSGSVDGWPFLTTRLATRSLQDSLKSEGNLSGQSLAGVAVEIGEAVSALHSEGYAHCDLSPGNILFLEDGAHLTDFGSATRLGEKQARPQGTYAFMSPEQVRGEALDSRSDVFSLAVLLWHCATGEKIFWRNAQHLTFMAVVDAVLPEFPEELAPLESLLRAALHKDQSERPSDARALCEEFAIGAVK